MNKIKRTKKLGHEDLMRELARIEHQLLKENRAAAMNLMVLEAKLRERFQQMEYRIMESGGRTNENSSVSGLLDMDDVKDLIPQELPPFPTFEELDRQHRKKRTWETIGTAALLAVVTALGVFGLATVLHVALSWLA